MYVFRIRNRAAYKHRIEPTGNRCCPLSYQCTHLHTYMFIYMLTASMLVQIGD